MTWSDTMAETPPAQPATCTSCAGGTLGADRVRMALWRGDELVVIEDIPALVCRACGEQYFEDETALALDMMRGRQGGDGPPARVMSVPVFTYTPPGGNREEER